MQSEARATGRGSLQVHSLAAGNLCLTPECLKDCKCKKKTRFVNVCTGLLACSMQDGKYAQWCWKAFNFSSAASRDSHGFSLCIEIDFQIPVFIRTHKLDPGIVARTDLD